MLEPINAYFEYFDRRSSSTQGTPPATNISCQTNPIHQIAPSDVSLSQATMLLKKDERGSMLLYPEIQTNTPGI